MSLLGSRDEFQQGEIVDERDFEQALSDQRRRRTVPLRLPRLTLPTILPEEDQLSGTYYERDATYRRALVVADVFAAALAFLCAVALGGTGLALTAIIVLPVVVLASKLMGLYDRDELVFHKSTLNEAPKLFHLATLFALLVRLLQGALVHGSLNTRQLLVLWISFLLLVVAGRTLARRAARRIAAPERCLIVGPSGQRMRLAHKLASSQRAHTEVVGYLPLEDERRQSTDWNGRSRRRRSVTIADLPEIVRELDVHRVIIIPGNADGETMLDAISRGKAMGVKVSILPRMFEVVGSSVEFDDLDGVTVLGVRRFGLARSSSFIKRSMDVTCSAVGLVFISPLLALVAAAIKLDSPGTVFFRQTRIGKDGRPFSMLKFRSMVDGADAQKLELLERNEAEGLFKIADDPRITRVGKWIRKLSLDELPQLVNVLRGEMSLVGPRPLVVEDDQRVEGRHRRRLRLLPGMTGPWQVLGSSRIPLSEMVNIDYLYGANWSLWTDVKILLRTAEHVLGRRGQ
ncbi:MAG: sugar transferase [Solirubrobacterales bacterium]|nr:sugar transferase [Solirubrobacterales bacterium]